MKKGKGLSLKLEPYGCIDTNIGDLCVFRFTLGGFTGIEKEYKKSFENIKEKELIISLIEHICCLKQGLIEGRYKPNLPLLKKKDINMLSSDDIENISKLYLKNNSDMYKNIVTKKNKNIKGKMTVRFDKEGIKYPKIKGEKTSSYLYRLLVKQQKDMQNQMEKIFLPFSKSLSSNILKTSNMNAFKNILEQQEDILNIYGVNKLPKSTLDLIETKNALNDFGKMSKVALENVNTITKLANEREYITKNLLDSFPRISDSLLKHQTSIVEKLAIQFSTKELIKGMAFPNSFSKIIESFNKINFNRIGFNIGLNKKLSHMLTNNYAESSFGYTNYLQSIDNLNVDILSLPEITITQPSIDFHNETKIIESISTEDRNKIKEKEPKKKYVIIIDNELESLLKQLNPNLFDLWQGAIMSLNSENPDKVRHFSSSVRELITNILHILAPNDKIKIWTNEPTYFYKNNPTRRARLDYIYREINFKPFNKYLELDLKNALETFDLLSKGVHKLDNHLNQQQLNYIKIRAESIIKSLIQSRK